jgi:carbon storage regulator CsrA
MLILTRKLNEEILIGEDIKVTLVRVRGNTVRIGIEAPRDVRIVRGELDSIADPAEDDLSGGGPQVAACEEPFAHPVDHSTRPAEQNRIAPVTTPQVFVGSVKRSGKDVRLTRAPLAEFVSAS